MARPAGPARRSRARRRGPARDRSLRPRRHVARGAGGRARGRRALGRPAWRDARGGARGGAGEQQEIGAGTRHRQHVGNATAWRADASRAAGGEQGGAVSIPAPAPATPCCAVRYGRPTARFVSPVPRTTTRKTKRRCRHAAARPHGRAQRQHDELTICSSFEMRHAVHSLERGVGVEHGGQRAVALLGRPPVEPVRPSLARVAPGPHGVRAGGLEHSMNSLNIRAAGTPRPRATPQAIAAVAPRA